MILTYSEFLQITTLLNLNENLDSANTHCVM